MGMIKNFFNKAIEDNKYPFGTKECSNYLRETYKNSIDETIILKEDFYETFHKSGKYHDENNRFSTDEWLAKFKRYLSQIKSGSIKNYDEMSLSLFPTRCKKSPKDHDFM